MIKWISENRPGRWKLPSFLSRNKTVAKLTAILLVAAALHVPADGFSQTITFSGKRISLQRAFDEIKKQTDYVYAVVYNPERIDTASIISVNAKNLPLEDFIKAILTKQSLSYTIVGTTIVVYRNEDNTTGSGGPGTAVRDISGIVFDLKAGTPLAGVSVVNGEGRGTQTDGNGMFRMKNVKRSDSVSFSFIGYEKFITAANYQAASISVPMTITTNELDQAVVQAYGITSKRLATGNIGRVTAEEIEKQPVMNPLMALEGRVAGLTITPTSGYASSPVKVEIRGRNSINPNFLSEPLYVIDGIPLTVLDVNGATRYTEGVSPGFVQGGLISNTNGQSPLFSLNPRNIESIEVLKDGDATAIYGSRGANGVILITTKKGKPGKTAFSMGVTKGIIDIPRQWNFLNTQQYLQMRREAFKNDGITPTAANAPDLTVWDTTRYTDWQKELLGMGSQLTVSAGLSGGNSQTTFNLNANYDRQVDLLNRTGASQNSTLSFNARHNSQNNKLSVSLTTNYSYSVIDAINDRGNISDQAPNAPPIFDGEGNLNYAEWNAANLAGEFPFAYILTPSISKTYALFSSLNINYTLAKGLTIGVSAGYNDVQNSNNYFNPIISQNPLFNPTGTALFGTTKNINKIIEPQLNYSAFIGKGRLSVLAGGTLQTVSTSGVSTSAFGYTNDDLIQSVSNASFQQVTEGFSEYKYVAVFGRINYNLENKYMINLTGRRDGSSRFGEGRQFGNFGSVGASWIISEEKWLSGILASWVSLIKFRGSYGITGSDGRGDYQSLSQWAIGPNQFSTLYPYDGIRAFMPIHAVNQDYQWESNEKTEVGLELGFLQDRITLDVSYYSNRSGNQLTDLPTPLFSGFPSVFANWAANVQNTGLEVVLNAKLINKKDWSWNVNFNIGANRNKLLAYPGIEYSPYFSTYKVGQSLNTRYYFHHTGVDPQTGKYSFIDFNHDGIVTRNDAVSPGTMNDDRYVGIDLTPEYSGGFRTQFGFKDLSLSLFFIFRKQLGSNPFGNMAAGGRFNLPVEALDNHWQKPGDKAVYTGFSTIGSSTLNYSDGLIVDASFIRLNNIELSYSLPDKIIQKAGMKDCKLFARAQNVFTITSYEGLDPTVQGFSSLPTPRILVGGVSFNF